MASHALNRLDASNWKQPTESPQGSTVSVEYVSPTAEARHLARVEDQSRPEIDDVNLRAAIMVAVEDRTQSSSALASAAVKWAQQAPANSPDHRWVVTACALLLVRDGDDDVRARNQEWARLVFADITRKKMNPLYEAAHTLAMNPAATAFVGTTHLLKDNTTQADIRALLDLATRRTVPVRRDFLPQTARLQGWTNDFHVPSLGRPSRPAFARAIRGFTFRKASGAHSLSSINDVSNPS